MAGEVGPRERSSERAYDDRAHDDLIAAVQRRVAALAATARRAFTTDAHDLFDAYLEALPDAERDAHRCAACRRFVERYGHLATIGDDGVLRPLLWDGDDASPSYGAAVRALADRVAKAKVTGVFVSGATVWGKPEAGGWTHLHVRPPETLVQPASAIEGRDESTASGYSLSASSKTWTCTLRVTAKGGLRSTVALDRWD